MLEDDLQHINQSLRYLPSGWNSDETVRLLGEVRSR